MDIENSKLTSNYHPWVILYNDWKFYVTTNLDPRLELWCDTTVMIPIVETNNRVTTPTGVHAEDRIDIVKRGNMLYLQQKKLL